MEIIRDQQTRTGSKTRLVDQINICLRSGGYSRALDLLASSTAEFPNDAELSKLEKLARDGVKRNAEAQRLITESQDLFAQQKSSEAIQLLRQAYELDKNNSLARAILANALVEHAHSIVETDWLEAETLTNQALKLNPAHPTAKTIRSLIVDQKKISSVEDWVERTRKLQSSGDLFAALAWVAEGLAVHPDEPKLLQVHDAILRDQAARRRQARRGDVEDLRRMELAIDDAADAAAKQALAERIQSMAAKYWTDGEILAVANRLLHRLGFAPERSSSPSPQIKSAAVIFHVPRPTSPPPPPPDSSQVLASHVPTSHVPPVAAPPIPVPTSRDLSISIPPAQVPTGVVDPSKISQPSVAPPDKVPTTPPEPLLPAPQTTADPAVERTESPAEITSPSSPLKPPATSNSKTLILISAAAMILVAATFFLTRKHYTAPVAKTPSAAPIIHGAAISAPTVSAPNVSPNISASAIPAPAPPTPQPLLSLPAVRVSSDTAPGKVTRNNLSPGDSDHNLLRDQTGTLIVVAGQDDASVFLDGKLQPQLTQAGQLRLPNLELKDYVVQVSKNGFQDPPPQKIRIGKGERATLNFNLQPQPLLASLTIQGGTPETTVLVDQTVVGTIHADGALFVSTVNPGDHTVELRKEGFKPRQFKKHFAIGATISHLCCRCRS